MGDVKHSVGDVVNDTVTTMCGARWGLELLGDHFISYVNIYHYAVHPK